MSEAPEKRKARFFPKPTVSPIPRVIVRRVWPSVSENEDPDSLRSIALDIECLWGRMVDENNVLDDPEFFGATAGLWMDEPGAEGHKLDLTKGRSGNAIIGIANYSYLEARWPELLLHPCWKGQQVNPPANVMSQLMVEQLGSTVDAVQTLTFERDNAAALKILEDQRRRCVSVTTPSMALFLASLTAKGLRSQPTQRNDEPTAVDIENGRTVLQEMKVKRPSVEKWREAFREAGFKASNLKLALIWQKIGK